MLMDQDATNVLARVHIGVGLIDLFNRISVGNQFVQFDPALLVHLEKSRDIDDGIAQPVEHSLDSF